MKDLGTLGGSIASGWAINEAGQVTGESDTFAGARHAFLYGQMTDLGTLGGYTSQGFGINNSGEVVGDAGTAIDSSHAFLYTEGQMYDLNDMIDPALGITLTDNQALTIAVR